MNQNINQRKVHAQKTLKIFMLFLLFIIPLTLFAQRTVSGRITDSLDAVAKRFEMQLSAFPQEKVYLQTDKPYYLAGERIWFRAHVVDAASHLPDFSANCVYAELFDARDSVIFPKDIFPSGVSNLLLMDKNMLPVSERLVFVYNAV